MESDEQRDLAILVAICQLDVANLNLNVGHIHTALIRARKLVADYAASDGPERTNAHFLKPIANIPNGRSDSKITPPKP